RRAVEERRQGARRQLGLSTVSTKDRQCQGHTIVRDRRWKARRRGPFRRNLRAADERESDAAAGRAPLSRFAASRKSLLAHEGDHAHTTNLPFVRRRHPWPCVLFFPGPRDAKASQ